jgi:hypothetical protein
MNGFELRPIISKLKRFVSPVLVLLSASLAGCGGDGTYLVNPTNGELNFSATSTGMGCSNSTNPLVCAAAVRPAGDFLYVAAGPISAFGVDPTTGTFGGTG